MPFEASDQRPPFAHLIAGLPLSTPFVAPEALIRKTGVAIRLRLGANESAFGVSPTAQAAMREAAHETHWYGDPENYDLRNTLSSMLRVGSENVVVGNGIDGLLGYIVRAYVDPGTPVVLSLGTYPTFAYHVTGFGGDLIKVPYRQDRADLAAILDAIKRTDARLVYLANPDNPSGTWFAFDEMESFFGDLPPTCLCVVDEAYCDFATPGTLPAIDGSRPNIIHVRTFSKAHGMAGARVGYAIASAEIIATMNKFRNQFEVSRISQIGALASLSDPGFVQRVVRAVEEGRRDYELLASGLGLPTIPSATNFVCIDVGGPERARRLIDQLLQRGVFIRMPGSPPLNRCIRVTVGTPPQRAKFSEIFSAVWKEFS